MRGGPSRGAPRGDHVVPSWCPLGAEGGAARQHTAVPLVLGTGTGPCGSQPVASPLFGLPPRSPAPRCLFLAASQPRGASSASAWRAFLCPFPLLNHSHGRGRASPLQERPGHPHARTSSSRLLPWEEDIALKFPAGCLCKYPPCSSSSLRVLARPSGCAGGEERSSAWVLGQDVRGAGWLLGSCRKLSGPIWGRSPALDSKRIGGSEGEEGFSSSSIPAPENPPAASPAPARPPRRTARLLLLCFCPRFSAKLRHSQERQSQSPKFAVWRCWVTRLWVEVLGQGCGRQSGLGSAPRSPSRHQTR